jgi:hypothetical protein
MHIDKLAKDTSIGFKSVLSGALYTVLCTSLYTGLFACLLASATGLSVPAYAAKESATMQVNHQKWLSDRIDEAHKIKPAMTEADLLKVFDMEGGLQSKPASRYVLKSCPMIKINVTFKTVKNELVIATISPIYIDHVITD